MSKLGSALSAKVNLEAEISKRLEAAGVSVSELELQNRVFHNKCLTKQTKIKVYKAVVLPILLDGSEAWTTHSHNRRALEKFHNRMVRSLLGTKWQDRHTMNSVYKQTKTRSR